ncbi:sugar phosphate isomerase/epimerase [Hamadaea flava]|uniref:Sugar phosphate isomerase/epimerase family protein n=1 Tax=Hamadaea flava TaxID=1742688 RepID=A0ABV8LMP0_9ACTN|nr:TIM barrel protein [Hamadaea flava]MCP2323128.1 sugar phosphate isomerase/epimerase [Hamadaea flava]
MSALSVQLYSVRDSLRKDPAATLERLAAAGFDEVEPFDLVEWAPRLEEPLRTTGLRARTGHASLLTAPDLPVIFDAAARLGITTVIEPTVRDGWQDLRGVATIADSLNHCAERASSHGLTIGYHNHWWEFTRLAGTTALEQLAGMLHPPVVLELDVYWAAVGGADVTTLATGLAGQIRHLHVKDGPIEQDPASQVPAGTGRVDLAGVLAAVPGATRVLEFDAYAGDVFAALAEGAAWVRTQTEPPADAQTEEA